MITLTEAEARTAEDAANDRAEQLEDQINSEVGLTDDVREELAEARRELLALQDRINAQLRGPSLVVLTLTPAQADAVEHALAVAADTVTLSDVMGQRLAL